MTASDIDTQVRALLAVAGLRPAEEEIQVAIRGYPALREAMQRLYDVPIDHEEDIALEVRVQHPLSTHDRARPAASANTATDASTSRS